MSEPSSSRCKPRSPTSPSTDESSPKFTPSTRSSHSSDGLSILNETNSFELRAIPRRDDFESKEEKAAEHALLPNARRTSIDSAQSYELYTPDEDRAVLQKLDRKLVTFMALLYCLSFLDRSSECFLQVPFLAMEVKHIRMLYALNINERAC
jgi:hypothetical protein